MSRRNWKLLVILTAAVVFLIALVYTVATDEDDAILSYDKVITEVENQNVSKVVLSGTTLRITMKDGSEEVAIIPSEDEFTSFISDEIKNGNEIEFVIKSSTGSAFLTVFQLVIYGSFLFYMIRMMSGGNFSIKPISSSVKFSDVAGIDEEKDQLQETVEFLKNPEKYSAAGARIPKGILLHGAPGTGKTLLAKAIAGEAGVPFYQANGSSFEEKFVGVGASRIRKLFNTAKKNAPAIIFIDEIDSVAQNRYSGKSYSEQTLNQLLAEMDGFETNSNVIVIAATNHLEVLDPAITRPGRFDRQVFIPNPDVNAREKILLVHSRNKKYSDDVDLREVAKKTVGFSGADLENVLNEAAIICANLGNIIITMDNIDEAIARVLVGLKKEQSAITENEKRLTAVHEAGHAVVSKVVRPDVKNFGISIVPRGNAGGYNMFDESNRTFAIKSDLAKQMQVLYGGRLAEECILGDISSGASNDFEKASKIAHSMVTRFAMNGRLMCKIGGENTFNEHIDELTISEAETICRENYDLAKIVVESNKELVLKLADLLIEKEYLTQEDVERFFAEN